MLSPDGSTQCTRVRGRKLGEEQEKEEQKSLVKDGTVAISWVAIQLAKAVPGDLHSLQRLQKFANKNFSIPRDGELLQQLFTQSGKISLPRGPKILKNLPVIFICPPAVNFPQTTD